jgi:adenylate cyclase
MSRSSRSILPDLSIVKKYRYRFVFYVALCWTIIDSITELAGFKFFSFRQSYSPYGYNGWQTFLIRELSVFVMSLFMAYLLVFKLKKVMISYPFWIRLIVKSFILIACAFLMNFLVNMVHSTVVLDMSFTKAWNEFYKETMYTPWLYQKIPYWLMLYLVTQLIVEINDKYSPGIFVDILMGRYAQPKVENSIVMFLDLKDSTPIAEKLGNELYFRFIRDFIYYISYALLEYSGRIYQYVGDEIVVSWEFSNKNTRRCMDALIEARKNLQKNSERFRRMYGITPEFRVGIHCGNVTVGEIGVVKKDLAMSGDTMNTTARIRSACSELNQKFIVSKQFLDNIDLAAWQAESLGFIELKGKHDAIELFALKI